MRAHLTVLSLVAALTMTVGVDASGQASTDPHFRPADASDSGFVADSLRRSQTVRDLAGRLKDTDVVAYVTVAPVLPGEPDSSIRVAGRSHVQRFMVIKINNALALDRQVALVGHELQHAVDMSRAGWVTDATRMQTYFTIAGWRKAYPERGFETLSALQTERKVGRELVAAEPAVGQGSARPR